GRGLGLGFGGSGGGSGGLGGSTSNSTSSTGFWTAFAFRGTALSAARPPACAPSESRTKPARNGSVRSRRGVSGRGLIRAGLLGGRGRGDRRRRILLDVEG